MSHTNLSEHSKFHTRNSKRNRSHLQLLRQPRHHRNHGHRTYRAIGARVPEATSHLLELKVEDEVHQSWQGRTKMVQGRWTGIPNTKDRH